MRTYNILGVCLCLIDVGKGLHGLWRGCFAPPGSWHRDYHSLKKLMLSLNVEPDGRIRRRDCHGEQLWTTNASVAALWTKGGTRVAKRFGCLTKQSFS